jgi:hypothetical protein
MIVGVLPVPPKDKFPTDMTGTLKVVFLKTPYSKKERRIL